MGSSAPQGSEGVVSTGVALAVVAVVAATTYAMRAGLIVLLADTTLPPAVERALRYVGPAVLAALAINLATGGAGGPQIEVAEACALIVAAGLAWWRRPLVVVVVAAMATLWILTPLT
jgi:branched-subunit amino acid transport protein